MKKKIVALCLCVAMLTVAVAGASLAYFTDTKEAENTFTVGNVEITLTEPNWDEKGSVDAETVYAGEALAKDPTVTNVGANPCFVRVKVTGLDQFGDKGLITYEDTDTYAENSTNEGWTYHNGYFYWTAPLDLNGTTAPVFDQIRMPTGLTGGEETQPIVVTAEAVQAQGARPSWTAVQSMTVAEIAAWFATCGM